MVFSNICYDLRKKTPYFELKYPENLVVFFQKKYNYSICVKLISKNEYWLKCDIEKLSSFFMLKSIELFNNLTIFKYFFNCMI